MHTQQRAARALMPTADTTSSQPAAPTTQTATDASDQLPFLRAVSPVHELPQPKRTITLPGNVEAAEVVRALLTNSELAGTPIAAHLWLADRVTGTLRLIHAEGKARPDGSPCAIEGTVLGAAVSRGTAQIEPVHRSSGPDEEVVVWRYALPLSAGESDGVAGIDFLGPVRPDLERFTPVIGAMRGVLCGALALQIARDGLASARAIAESTRDLAGAVDPDIVVAAALERAIAIATAQTGSVMLLGDDGRMRIAASRGLPPEVVNTVAVAEGEGIAGWVLASGQPLLVEDANGRGVNSRRHGVRSAVSVPICDGEGTLGVLNVGSRAVSARFSDRHLRALETLANTTAVALRNARASRIAHDQYFDTLRALALAMEARDPYAFDATARVLELCVRIGEALSLQPAEIDSLRIAALLHDIGMTAAGEVVTVSNRQLSTVEWGMLKMHPVIAAEILGQAPALKDAVPIVYHHHEHYDGGGYVGGLAGESIPLGARILAVADSYVAMTSERPYRRALAHADVLAELVALSGSQFDPLVVQTLAEVLAERGAGLATSTASEQ